MLLQGIRNMFNNPSTSIVEKFIFHLKKKNGFEKGGEGTRSIYIEHGISH